MSKIKRLCGLCLKKDDFTGVNKNKCKVLALWGKYLAVEPLSDNESDDEECPLLEFNDKGEPVEVDKPDGSTPDPKENKSDKQTKDTKNTRNTKDAKDEEPEFVCDHTLEDTGYVTVRRVKNRIIKWNDGEVDTKGKALDDLELEWDKDLKVYLSTNEADDDDQTWLRVLKIV